MQYFKIGLRAIGKWIEEGSFEPVSPDHTLKIYSNLFSAYRDSGAWREYDFS